MARSLWGPWFAVRARRPLTRRPGPSCRPRLEALEDRSLPSVFHVTDTLDSGPGSLRQALLDANAHAGNGRNLIDFSSKLTGPIDLLTALPAVDNDVTIHAEGERMVTVERSSAAGTPDFRIFTINAGRTVGIEGLTIANGRVTGDVGGGILNLGTLVLDRSVTSGNTSLRNPSFFAGGQGGGIENVGNLTIQNSLVTGNSADFWGGGLHNTNGGTATLDGATVSNNSCSYDGAGIRSEASTTLTIADSLISGNNAGSFSTGGLASGGKLTITDTLISDNTGEAAGIYLLNPNINGQAPSGDVVISRSTIRNNRSTFGVGGIWSFSGGKILIEDSTITGNTGTIAGGFFGFGTPLQIIRSTISGNTGSEGAGGVYAFGDSTIEDSTISGNTGNTAGGVAGFGFGFKITRSTISGNTALASRFVAAGGVYAGYATIDDSTISGNTVIADHMRQGYYYSGAAGGVLVQFPGTTIDHSTIAFNRVVDAPSVILQVSGGVTGLNWTSPGGVSFLPMANVAVHDTIIARNTSIGAGDPDVNGSFQSGGHNLIGVLGASATGFVASDLRGSAAAPLDPRLRRLGYYGGPTQTHALMPDSPAINAGDNTNAPPTDQRGRPRIIGGTIDIGSFEAGGSGDDDDFERREGAGTSAAPASQQGTGGADSGPLLLAASGGTAPEQEAFTEWIGPVRKARLRATVADLATWYETMPPARAGDPDPFE